MQGDILRARKRSSERMAMALIKRTETVWSRAATWLAYVSLAGVRTL